MMVILLGEAKSLKPPAMAIASRMVVSPRSSSTPGFWTSPRIDTRMLRTSLTATVTSGLGMNSPSAVEILSRSCIAVRPEAWMSCRSGIEILPSGRTGATRESVSFFQTVICRMSPGPMTYVDEMAVVAPVIGVGPSIWGPGAAGPAGAAGVAVRDPWPELPGEAFWAATAPGPRTRRSAASPSDTVKRVGVMMFSFRLRPSAHGRVLLEPHVLDLVEERAIADLQHL